MLQCVVFTQRWQFQYSMQLGVRRESFRSHLLIQIWQRDCSRRTTRLPDAQHVSTPSGYLLSSRHNRHDRPDRARPHLPTPSRQHPALVTPNRATPIQDRFVSRPASTKNQAILKIPTLPHPKDTGKMSQSKKCVRSGREPPVE